MLCINCNLELFWTRTLTLNAPGDQCKVVNGFDIVGDNNHNGTTFDPLAVQGGAPAAPGRHGAWHNGDQ
jgi:hypothetical protein